MENTNELETKIQIVQRQTTYSREEIIYYLTKYNGNVENVIKQYLGIPIQADNKIKTSVNQEIFKQFRKTLPIVSSSQTLQRK